MCCAALYFKSIAILGVLIIGKSLENKSRLFKPPSFLFGSHPLLQFRVLPPQMLPQSPPLIAPPAPPLLRRGSNSPMLMINQSIPNNWNSIPQQTPQPHKQTCARIKDNADQMEALFNANAWTMEKNPNEEKPTAAALHRNPQKHHKNHRPSASNVQLISAQTAPPPDTKTPSASDHYETTDFHEEPIAGQIKPPPCAAFNPHYCPFTQDYPVGIVTQVVKYLKWPLEKLFRDLRTLQSPTLADTGTGALVCDSITRIVRPGWARNTNGRWLVAINTVYYDQSITEIICKYNNVPCNFVAGCYYATCQQRYNMQTLLVIDPLNPYKGPFLSQFLFPSGCVCYIPDHKEYPQPPTHTEL